MDTKGLKWIGTAGLATLLLAGCRSHPPDIVFSDEASMPHLKAEAPDRAEVKKNGLALADEQKIDVAVFSNLLTRHFWEDGGYTAIFLSADDPVVAAMQKRFAGRKPPIKESFRANVQPNMAPRDKDTGQPAMILSVDVTEPEADGSVTAIGKWYAGGAVAGFYSYQLKPVGGDWVIQNAQ